MSSFTINLHSPSLAATIEVEACYFWVILLMSKPVRGEDCIRLARDNDRGKICENKSTRP
jgi:hypothetical protein